MTKHIFVIHYDSWEQYEAESKEEAIAQFKADGHDTSEITQIDD